VTVSKSIYYILPFFQRFFKPQSHYF